MRCRSCHTVMMETDVACPTCRAPGPAAHGQGKKMPGLTAVFPLLGMMVFCAMYPPYDAGSGEFFVARALLAGVVGGVAAAVGAALDKLLHIN